MSQNSESSRASLIPQPPIPEGAQDFSKLVHGLLDAIAAGLYSMASMLVGEGEDGVRLVETAVATAEVSACQNAAETRKSSRKALVKAALELLEQREPGSLAAPEGIEPTGSCIEEIGRAHV